MSCGYEGERCREEALEAEIKELEERLQDSLQEIRRLKKLAGARTPR